MYSFLGRRAANTLAAAYDQLLKKLDNV